MFDVPTGQLLASSTGQYGFAINGELAGDFAGYQSIANAGDVNGDGFEDVIIGAVSSDAAGTNAGRAYVVFGGTGGYSNFDLSQLSVAGNGKGFIINGGSPQDLAKLVASELVKWARVVKASGAKAD